MREYAKDHMSKPTMSKAEADYRPGSLDERCELCMMFRQPGQCTLVQGKIKPSDVCDYFKRK